LHHPIKNKLLKRIIQFLPETKKQAKRILWFVVPSDIYPQFKKQPISRGKDEKEVKNPIIQEQRVLLLPEVPDEPLKKKETSNFFF